MIVTVVVTNHNGKRFLPKCLEAVLASKLPEGTSLQTVVVDNGSTDGSEEVIGRYPDVEPLIYRDGLGFARANNRARSVARGDVVCFLNNDTCVDPDWLLRPLEILRGDPDVSGVGSKLLYMHAFVPVELRLRAGAEAFVHSQIFDGPLDSKVRWSSRQRGMHRGREGYWMSAGDRVYLPVPIPGLDPEPKRAPILTVGGTRGNRVDAVSVHWPDGEATLARVPGIFRLPLPDASTGRARLIQNAGSAINAHAEGHDVGAGDEDDGTRFVAEEVVPLICGAALFVRRDELDAVGWFPESYGMYYEDTDLCVRLRQRGKRLVFCPRSIVSHYHTGTTREWSPFFIENVTRSHAIFVTRHAAPSLVREALGTIGSVTMRRAGALLVRGRRAWNADPQLRGTVKSIPAVARALVERARDGSIDSLSTDRHPYTFKPVSH